MTSFVITYFGLSYKLYKDEMDMKSHCYDLFDGFMLVILVSMIQHHKINARHEKEQEILENLSLLESFKAAVNDTELGMILVNRSEKVENPADRESVMEFVNT